MEIDNSVDVLLSASVHVISDWVCYFLIFQCAPYASTQQTRLTISTRAIATMHVYNCVFVLNRTDTILKRPRFSVVRMVRIGFIDINNAHFHVTIQCRCANVGFYYGIHVYCISHFVAFIRSLSLGWSPCVAR